jgi:hypothetical protein
MLELVQLEFLIGVLELGPRDDLKVAQTNADRTLAPELLEMESRTGSPAAVKLATRIFNLPAFPVELESRKAAAEVLSAEVNMLTKSRPRRIDDRGPLTRHLVEEAHTSQ